MFYDLESKEFGASCMSNGALNYPLFTLEPRATVNIRGYSPLSAYQVTLPHRVDRVLVLVPSWDSHSYYGVPGYSGT